MDNLPKAEPLIFPRGVRFPRKDEIPVGERHVLDRLGDARITTGYVLQRVENKPFDTYIEANVHAPQIFEVFRTLSLALIPEIAAPLIGLKDDDPVFGPYTDRAMAISIFEPFIDQLQNDGFVEFGLLHQSTFGFEEVFVASPKYFKIWTNNNAEAERILRSFGLPRCERLQFIDEFPMVSLSVNEEDKADWPGTFYAIQDEFPKLPEPIILDRDQ